MPAYEAWVRQEWALYRRENCGTERPVELLGLHSQWVAEAGFQPILPRPSVVSGLYSQFTVWSAASPSAFWSLRLFIWKIGMVGLQYDPSVRR